MHGILGSCHNSRSSCSIELEVAPAAAAAMMHLSLEKYRDTSQVYAKVYEKHLAKYLSKIPASGIACC
jgi:hypothetical protein